MEAKFISYFEGHGFPTTDTTPLSTLLKVSLFGSMFSRVYAKQEKKKENSSE